jgi:Sec-independent protein translocase protein TatA
MSFMGMGFLEILVVFLIGFVLVGPERMMEMGKKAGKLLGELRRMSEGLQESISMTDFDDPNQSIMRNITSPRPPTAGARSRKASAQDGEDEDGPVAFRQGGSSSEVTTAGEPDSDPVKAELEKPDPEGHDYGPDRSEVTP